MTTRIAQVTPRGAALVAGVGYVAIFVLAVFGNFVVIEGLIESGDASATAANILESESLFRAGLVAFAIVFVVDVVVAIPAEVRRFFVGFFVVEVETLTFSTLARAFR